MKIDLRLTFHYGLTIFLSAFLLFQVQPMIGKMILPWFGGSASVWTTCMLFFQMILLLGYLLSLIHIFRTAAETNSKYQAFAGASRSISGLPEIGQE